LATINNSPTLSVQYNAIDRNATEELAVPSLESSFNFPERTTRVAATERIVPNAIRM